MSEVTPTCRIHEKYRLIECKNPALPWDPHGFCILHSESKEKSPAVFREAIQARLEQGNAKLLDFRGVWFPLRFDWRNYFGKEVFDNPIDFSWAHFAAEVIFSGAIFKENVDFLRARFTRDAHFYRAEFRRRAKFSFADFGGEADFYGANFVEPADFRWAKIRGRMIFKGGYEQGKAPGSIFVFPRWGDFRFLQLGPEAVLRFQDLSLEKVEFTGTDLRLVEFRHVTWHAYRGRQAIYDEVLLRQEEKDKPWFLTWVLHYAPYENPPSPWPDRYGEVERLYRNLKLNYIAEGDNKNAGDFHYGEMEMHRRASKWGWFPFNLYYLYRILSGYGERPSWALGWLALFLFGLAGLVWSLGLEIGQTQQLAGFNDAFIYILQKVTLQRPTWAEPVGFGGKLIAGLSVLLIPGQAALFLLALRNRLGRRR